MTDHPAIRKGMPSPKLDKEDFIRRYKTAFKDPAFGAMAAEIDRIADIAWDAYSDGRKAPLTQKAGPGYKDPEYDIAIDWIAARAAIDAAQKRHEDAAAVPRILLVSSSPRNEHTCPGEMSKTFRLTEIAKGALERQGMEVDVLDLSRTTAEYGRTIHPCKACFSTSPALCHWPCSCYPNYSLGQNHDWMNEIYPLWVAAHGVMIVTPVHWYQATSPLKLMIDRLVCADGGNADPTSTHGKKAAVAKEMELAGWDYPKHLEGRLFALAVHGDAEGTENLRRSLSDWLRSMGLQSAGYMAELDRYIGYWKPYATSHDDLDADTAVQKEVENAALTLAQAVTAKRKGAWTTADEGIDAAREK